MSIFCELRKTEYLESGAPHGHELDSNRKHLVAPSAALWSNQKFETALNDVLGETSRINLTLPPTEKFSNPADSAGVRKLLASNKSRTS